jgi:hypothetical protein
VPGCFSKIKVADPHLIMQSIWENLPPREKVLLTEREFSSQDWAPLDRRRFRIEPESYRTEVSIANVGALRLSRSVHSQATRYATELPAVDGFGISIIERGASRLVFPGTDEPVIANATMGYIFNVELGIRATQSDLHSRLLLRLPTTALRQKLEGLLEGQNVETITFEPIFDQTRGAGATIRRMLDYLFVELKHSDTLLTNEIAIRSFEENLALCLLLGLPHNYTERLGRQKAAAAPGSVRRAEEFMRANAGMPLTIAEIAEAAGCSVRGCKLRFTVSAALPRCGYCSRPDWNRREQRCCAPTTRNRWRGSPLSTALAVRLGSPSPSGTNTASIRRRCCGRGATPFPGSGIASLSAEEPRVGILCRRNL